MRVAFQPQKFWRINGLYFWVEIACHLLSEKDFLHQQPYTGHARFLSSSFHRGRLQVFKWRISRVADHNYVKYSSDLDKSIYLKRPIDLGNECAINELREVMPTVETYFFNLVCKQTLSEMRLFQFKFSKQIIHRPAWTFLKNLSSISGGSAT